MPHRVERVIGGRTLSIETGEVAGNADGSDRVLDDTVTSYLDSETYALVDGEWLKSDGVQLEVFEGALECVSAH